MMVDTIEKMPLYCKRHQTSKPQDFIYRMGKPVCVFCEGRAKKRKELKKKIDDYHRENLTDVYITKQLKKQKIDMENFEQKDELIEAKRLILEINKEADFPNKIVHTCGKHGQLKRHQVNINGRKADGSPYFKCKECQKKLARQHFVKHKEKVLSKQKEYRKADPQKRTEERRRYREKHYLKCLERARRYYHNNKERLDAQARKYKKKGCLTLNDWYVKKLIVSARPELSHADIPNEIVETKRVMQMLKREVNKLRLKEKEDGKD